VSKKRRSFDGVISAFMVALRGLREKRLGASKYGNLIFECFIGDCGGEEGMRTFGGLKKV
jgi:hypothetical protein